MYQRQWRDSSVQTVTFLCAAVFSGTYRAAACFNGYMYSSPLYGAFDGNASLSQGLSPPPGSSLKCRSCDSSGAAELAISIYIHSLYQLGRLRWIVAEPKVRICRVWRHPMFEHPLRNLLSRISTENLTS